MNADGATQILKILRERFAPDGFDFAFCTVRGRFSHLRRADQTIKVSLVEFDVLRNKAESIMQMGGGFPEAVVSPLSVQNASSSESEKSLVLASSQGDVNLSTAAKQMRRLFGLCGGAAWQDVLAAADADSLSGGESDHATRVAYRKAKKTEDS